MLSNESSIDTAALGLIMQRESARSSAVITEKSGLHEKKIGTNKGRIINALLFILYDFGAKVLINVHTLVPFGIILLKMALVGTKTA